MIDNSTIKCEFGSGTVSMSPDLFVCFLHVTKSVQLMSMIIEKKEVLHSGWLCSPAFVHRCPEGDRTPFTRLETLNLEYEILLALLFQMRDAPCKSLLCSIVVFLSRRPVTGWMVIKVILLSSSHVGYCKHQSYGKGLGTRLVLFSIWIASIITPPDLNWPFQQWHRNSCCFGGLVVFLSFSFLQQLDLVVVAEEGRKNNQTSLFSCHQYAFSTHCVMC